MLSRCRTPCWLHAILESFHYRNGVAALLPRSDHYHDYTDRRRGTASWSPRRDFHDSFAGRSRCAPTVSDSIVVFGARYMVSMIVFVPRLLHFGARCGISILYDSSLQYIISSSHLNPKSPRNTSSFRSSSTFSSKSHIEYLIPIIIKLFFQVAQPLRTFNIHKSFEPAFESYALSRVSTECSQIESSIIGSSSTRHRRDGRSTLR